MTKQSVNGKLFKPIVTRQTVYGGATSQLHTTQQLYASGTISTSSFRYDAIGSALKSTQQLNIDYTQFENHTFFNSAEVKCNVAFENIANRYPFDGTRREIEIFHDTLTGFEKWVFTQLPKNVGYLKFENDSYIRVDDHTGINFSAISRDNSGASTLNPGLKPITFEMYLHLPAVANDNQIILQKLSGTHHGFTIGVNSTSSLTNANIFMSFISASSVTTVSGAISKGDNFTHVAAVYDRRSDNDVMLLYTNGELIASSSTRMKIDEIDFNLAPLYIGSGSSVITGSSNSIFNPAHTLSGALDELRIFHTARTQREIQKYKNNNIYQEPGLKLYYKFNEPSGVIGVSETDKLNRVVLDSSGNSLTSFIDETTFDFTLRSTGSIATPLQYENVDLNPVLFMLFEPTLNLNRNLLSSASYYDSENLNLITRLIPSHYLDEGQNFHAFNNITGTIGNSIEGGMPGSAVIGEPQLLSALLYVIASELDELKLFIQHFANIIHVDYDDFDTTPDAFLHFAAAYQGFDLPGLFNHASAMQFVNAENINPLGGTSELSLRDISNKMWRRVLSNVNEIIKSKGTQHSIKSFLRTIGINPDSGFRIREYGGAHFGSIDRRREQRSIISKFVELQATTPDTFITSSILTTENHNEVGYPFIAGTDNDLILTSGSWTYESIYQFPITSASVNATSSLMRIITDDNGILTSLNAYSGSTAESSSIGLLCKPSSGSFGNTLRLYITGCNIVDGDRWHIACGRNRNDDPQLLNNLVSSSYFIHVTRMGSDIVLERYTTSSYFLESQNNDFSLNAFQNKNSFISMGSINWLTQSVDYLVDNDVVTSSADYRISRMRFWSKALTQNETYEHARNTTSIGVESPTTNFNNVILTTGSWERLRMDVSCDQYVTMSNEFGDITLFDFSQNNINMLGSFDSDTVVIKPEQISFSMLSSRFDEATSDDKIRIHGYFEQKNIDLYDAQVGPIYQTPHGIDFGDDTRLAIDFSVVDSLNDDIMNIFATFDSLENALGNVNCLFDNEYITLTKLRDVYFDRLVDKINLISFFEYFRWFDTNIGAFIEQLIPYKTAFLGTSYIIESHVLERPKFQYHFDNAYLGEHVRHNSAKSTFIQLIDGSMKKY